MGLLIGQYGPSKDPGDVAIARLATRQHGVVASWQLLDLGFSHSAIRRRVQAARLLRAYTGVYAVGHERLTQKGRWMAAVLACGPDAVLSHRTATILWDLRPLPGTLFDVTVPRSRRGHTGIRVHRVRKLAPEDRATVDGIPVTSVHRTLLDYAEISTLQQTRLAIESADRRELFDAKEMEATLERNPARKGTKKMRATLATITTPPPCTRSELEDRFLALIRDAGLPEPQSNVLIADELADFVWAEHRVIAEVDGYDFHRGRARFESDRVKDAKFQLAGYRTIHPTQQRIDHDGAALTTEITRLLEQ